MTLLPLELLAEVLSYVPSTRDILAVARTSKHFCAVLSNNKATDFIWRQARARCQPQPIPDPTPDFTEASYAAFLFDSKTCEVCELPSPGIKGSVDVLDRSVRRGRRSCTIPSPCALVSAIG